MSNEFIDISVEELQESVTTDLNLQCSLDWVVLEIGEFFRNHDRDYLYMVKGTDSSYGIGLEVDYAKYGIYFSRVDVISKDRTFLFLLSTDELLHDGHTLMEIHDRSKVANVEVILSDLAEVSIDLMLRVYEELDILNCKILNRITVDTIYTTEETTDIDFLDFSDFGVLTDNTETCQRLNAAKRISDYVKSAGKERRFAIKREDLHEQMSSDVFDGLVASYLPRGYKFYTNNYRNPKHFQDMINMFSREYMKITDYFDSIKNHLNFGVYVANEVDNNLANKYKRCDLFLIQIDNNQSPQVQLILMPIQDGQLQRQTKKVALDMHSFDYKEIDPKFLPYADQYLTDCKILQDESLHCSNTFCLSMQGKEFLAVFLGFGNSMRCRVSPVCGSIVWADMNIPYEKYSHVLPITIFDDGLTLAKGVYGGDVRGLTLKRNMPYYMDYYAVATIQFKTGRMDPTNCLLPDEVVGLYFIMSSAARVKKCTALFDSISKKSLWDMGFLSYYGGPLPTLQKEFIFKYGDLK